MKELSCPPGLNPKLTQYIRAYNALSNLDHLNRIFLLQKITQHMQTLRPDTLLTGWRTECGKEGIEAHLQYYGIHRDASFLVQSIEFAQAFRRKSADSILKPVDESGFYSALRERDKALNQEALSVTHAYIKASMDIVSYYNNTPALQDKVRRSLDILSLSYAKLSAMQQEVTQAFDTYTTKPLGEVDENGEPKGNNKNYIFTIEDKKLVLRVEWRKDLGREAVLDTYPVSQYFSEDYVTLIMPFEGDTSPLVISEFVAEGDLKHFAETYSYQDPKVCTSLAQNLFWQLSDYCNQLMQARHYNSDIKLSNFLTNGASIIQSDRKGIIEKARPKLHEMLTSMEYAAPEYVECFYLNEKDEFCKRPRKNLVEIDMPPFMAYQLGMALKEFLILTGLIPILDKDDYLDVFYNWPLLQGRIPKDNDTIRNLVILCGELTRANPKDRLTIGHAHLLLQKIDSLTTKEFLLQLESYSPKERLSTNHPERVHSNSDLTGFFESLFTRSFDKDHYIEALNFLGVAKDDEVIKEFGETLTDEEVNACFEDPRNIHLREFFEEAKDKVLTKHDRAEAGVILCWLYDLTGWSIFLKRVTTLEQLVQLPGHDPMADIYYGIEKKLSAAPMKEGLPERLSADADSTATLAKLSEPEAEAVAKVEPLDKESEAKSDSPAAEEEEELNSCRYYKRTPRQPFFMKAVNVDAVDLPIGGVSISKTVALGDKGSVKLEPKPPK